MAIKWTEKENSLVAQELVRRMSIKDRKGNSIFNGDLVTAANIAQNKAIVTSRRRPLTRTRDLARVMPYVKDLLEKQAQRAATATAAPKVGQNQNKTKIKVTPAEAKAIINVKKRPATKLVSSAGLARIDQALHEIETSLQALAVAKETLTMLLRGETELSLRGA